MPSRGNGPAPRTSAPESGTCSTAAADSATAGTSMFPVPRRMLAKVFANHTAAAPANSMFEYASASASGASRPPSRR